MNNTAKQSIWVVFAGILFVIVVTTFVDRVAPPLEYFHHSARQLTTD